MRPDFPTYRHHLHAESQRFREVLAGCDPAARVPACPDWDAADLLWHLGTVQHFWAAIVTGRPAGPDDLHEPDRPATYEELLGFFDEASAALLAGLDAADPADRAWTWSEEQSVGFTFRRQAHEALIHRLDAEQAAGQVTALDPALAADGVLETLDVMFGGTPAWGTFTASPQRVRVDLTDADESVWVQLGRFTGTDPDSGESHDEQDIHVVPDPGAEPEATVSGTAAALDAWLWKRGDDTSLTFAGEPEVLATFRACVSHPIN